MPVDTLPQPPSPAAPDRDNNFNLLRLIAALSVLVSHSFPLVHGDDRQEPLRRMVGTTLGLVAVDVFFVISGYLNTRSLERQPSATRFVVARGLRIFPALWVMLVVTCSGVALWFSELPWGSFWAHPATHRYLLRNATLVFGASYTLPGFADLPYPFAVNGSLWSLPLEVRMYAGLLGLWWAFRKARQLRVHRWLVLGVALASGVYAWLAQHHPLPHAIEARLLCAFAQGSAWALWQPRARTPERRDIAVFAAAVGALSLCAAMAPAAFFAAYLPALGFIVLTAARLPIPWVRQLDAWGDPSYGIYIYAFPIQQVLMATLHLRSPLALALIGAPLALAAGYASWHIVERRALRLKPR